MKPEVEDDNRKLRLASAKAKVLLGDAAAKLRAALDDEPFMAETPLET